MKAIKQPDGTWRAQLSKTDAGQIVSVQHMLQGVRVAEHEGQTADLAHTTLLGLESILQDRGPAPAEETDAK